MQEIEREYINKINETVEKLSEVNVEFSKITNRHGEAIETLGRDMLPLFDAIKDEEIPSHTAKTIIVAYRELFNMYLNQNTEVMKSMMKQMKASNILIEFLTEKISEKD